MARAQELMDTTVVLYQSSELIRPSLTKTGERMESTEIRFEQRHRRKIALLVTLSLLGISGCANRIPGGGSTYCIDTKLNTQIENYFEYAFFEYGRFKNEPVSANYGICGFREFHDLRIWWKRKGGNAGEHGIDLQKVIDELKSRQGGWFPTGSGEIQIRYDEPILKIELEILSYSYPAQFSSYLLYEFEMR